jgi:hypothetical protein
VDFQWKKRGPQLLFRAPPIRGRIRLHHAEVIALAILASARNRHLGSTVLPPRRLHGLGPGIECGYADSINRPSTGMGTPQHPVINGQALTFREY